MGAPIATRLGFLTLAFALLGLVMVVPSLGNPWFWDDLHWFRSYSADELLSTWTGTNDPSGIEVEGYRPLHALTNYVRFELFGESADANRLASVALLAGGLACIVRALIGVGVPALVAIGAACLALTSKNMTYTYAWPSEGYQALQYLTIGACALLTVRGVIDRRAGLVAGAAALWAVSLLVKDQGVLLLPALVLLTLAAGARAAGTADVRALRSDRLVRASLAATVGIAVAAAVARRVFVPGAPPNSVVPREYAEGLLQGMAFAGSELPAAAAAYAVLVAALAAYGLFVALRGGGHPGALALMGGAAVAAAGASAHALEGARPDLAYFPVLFFGLFTCAGGWLLWTRLERRRPAVAVLVAAAVLSTAFAVRESAGVQDAMGERSVQALAYNYEFIYGDFAFARMPRARRDAAVRALARAGVRGPVAGHDAFALLYCRAERGEGWARIPRVFAWDAFGREFSCGRS